MSAQIKEFQSTSHEVVDKVVGRPVLHIINGGQSEPEVVLGEMPAPTAVPANDGYDAHRYDVPPVKFELGGTHLLHDTPVLTRHTIDF